MILRKAIFFSFMLLLLMTPAVAQPNTKDSLISLLKTKLSPIDRAEILNQLAYQYYDFNDSIAFNYANEALRVARQEHYLKGMKYGYTMVGLGHSSKSEFKEAIRNYRLSDQIKLAGANADAAYNLGLLGNCYRDMARYDSALFIYRKAMTLTIAGDQSNKANIYKNLASVYILLWRNKEALVLLDSADGFFQKGQLNNQDNQYVKLSIWSLYGQVYKNMLKYDLSNQYYKKMCDASVSMDDYYHQIMCKLNQADLAYQRSNYAVALNFSFEALELTKKYVFPPQYVHLAFAHKPKKPLRW